VCRVGVPGVGERLRLCAPALMRVVELCALGLSRTSREKNVRKLLLDCVILLGLHTVFGRDEVADNRAEEAKGTVRARSDAG